MLGGTRPPKHLWQANRDPSAAKNTSLEGDAVIYFEGAAT